MKNAETGTLDQDTAPTTDPEQAASPDLPRYADTLGIRPIFRLTASFLAAVRALPLSHPALRLILALAHLTHHYVGRNANGRESVYEVGFRQPTPLLRRTIGPVASNDARAFRLGIAACQETDLFRMIKMADGGHEVHWAFAPDLLDRLFNPDDRYGLLDIRAVRDLERALPIHLYSSMTVAWRMREPEFALSVEELARIQGADRPSWEHLSRSFFGALSTVCVHKGAAALVRLEGEPGVRRVDNLVVEVLHGGSRWRPERLMRPSQHLKEFVLVHTGGRERICPDGVRASCIANILQTHQGSGAMAA